MISLIISPQYIKTIHCAPNKGKATEHGSLNNVEGDYEHN